MGRGDIAFWKSLECGRSVSANCQELDLLNSDDRKSKERMCVWGSSVCCLLRKRSNIEMRAFQRLGNWSNGNVDVTGQKIYCAVG